jgi:hypothetical protein
MQNTNTKDIGQKIMLAAGFLAAGLFVLVSMAANLKFGLSLATTPFDRIIYGALSLAADLMKVALPLVAILLWRKTWWSTIARHGKPGSSEPRSSLTG